MANSYNDFYKKIRSMLLTVTEECYQDVNTSNNLIYPYIVYSIDTSYQSSNVDALTLDINVFDRHPDKARVNAIQSDLRKLLHQETTMEHEFFMYTFIGGNQSVPKIDNELKQQLISVQGSIEWRRQ